jgi:hypothetical protein
MSVGVKGFRVGTGPRGNYVHMGRGGLYYKASLGGRSRQSRVNAPKPHFNPVSYSAENAIPIETGNVTEMVPSVYDLSTPPTAARSILANSRKGAFSNRWGLTSAKL